MPQATVTHSLIQRDPAPVSWPHTMIPDVVKIDVEAVGAMLDELIAPRSAYEELEPDYEYLEPAAHCTCSCH